MKRVLSGIQATGIPHIGNYIGAIKGWVDSQGSGIDAFYMVADLHAITVPQDPVILRKNRIGTVAGLMACGLSPKKVTIFFQSHIPHHAELGWILSSRTHMGELQRMTQYKSKSGGDRDISSLALFSYPVLQAADILLYQSTHVPVGQDQVQHIELTRNIAQRFNAQYGKLFSIPEAEVPEIGGRIMDLQDPTKKMSKSNASGPSGVIFITDSNDEIKQKISRAVTDSLNVIKFSEDQPGLANLITIYASLNDHSIKYVVDEFEGRGYGAFKKALIDVLVAKIEPIRERISVLLSHPDQLRTELEPSRHAAIHTADHTLASVKEAVGF